MGEYIRPGIYVNEFDKTQYTGFGTSTVTGVVGTTKKGPAMDITTVTSYENYHNKFGYDPTSYTDMLAKFFFKNSGNTLKVARATDNFRYAGFGVTPHGITMLDDTTNTTVVSTEAIGVGTGSKKYFSHVTDFKPTIEAGKVTVDWTNSVVAYEAVDASVNDLTGNLYHEGTDTTAEISTVVVLAATVASTLNSKYFLLNTNTKNYYVWFDYETTGVSPALDNLTGIKVTLASTDTTPTLIGDAITTAVDANVGFGAVNTTGTIVVTNAVAGACENAVDGNTYIDATHGLTVTVTTPGGGVTTSIGTINYVTGAVSLSFPSTLIPDVSTDVTMDYTQGYDGLSLTDTEIVASIDYTGDFISNATEYSAGLPIASWPTSGIIKIRETTGTEYMAYNDIDISTNVITFEGVERGVNSSTAATHYYSTTTENWKKIELVAALPKATVVLGESGSTSITFNGMIQGLFPEGGGTVKSYDGTDEFSYTYTACVYDDATKLSGTLTIPAAAQALTTADLILDLSTFGGYGDNTYDRYLEFDKWGEASYDEEGVMTNAGGVTDPALSYEFMNLMAKYPGKYANTETLVTVYNKTTWADSVHRPYYYGKVDVFPTTNDELLIIVEDATTGVIAEKFLVSTDPTSVDAFGKTQFITDIINDQSDYLKAFINSSYINQTTTMVGSYERVNLSGGTDGNNDDGIVSDGNIVNTFDLFDSKVDVTLDILSAGGYSSKLINNKIIAVCESRRDCFGILNVPYGLDVEDAIAYKAQLSSSTYTGIYYNWFEYFNSATNSPVMLPPAIQVTGIFIKNDFLKDAWFAPGGYNRAQLSEVSKLEHKLTEGDLSGLYAEYINPIVNISGNGPVVWGIKTMSSGQSAFSKINIRRLMIQIEKDISNSMLQFMFEQNNADTRTRVRMAVQPYLNTILARDGIEEGKVVCSEANNSNSTAQLGQLIVDIYVKPIYAIEYIILNFTVTKDAVDAKIA